MQMAKKKSCLKWLRVGSVSKITEEVEITSSLLIMKAHYTASTFVLLYGRETLALS